MIYGGWSQGATLASSVVRARPGMFDGVVLVEIGHTELDVDAVARDLRAGGVDRAIVSCSTLPCRAFASDARRAFARAGVGLRVTDVGLRGHWFDEPVFRVIGGAFPWLTEGDARWEGVARAVERRNATR
jgi:hypothetical protein